MTAVLAAPAAAPVLVVGSDERLRSLLTAALEAAEVELRGIVAAVGVTVEDAVAACAPVVPDLVVAERFSQIGVRRALRLGTSAMLRVCDLAPERVVAAVATARAGERRVPHEVLVRLLRGEEDGQTPLTPRQTSVLGLMAEGNGNADIAQLLGCSEHTVKNVIYELMGRLQARNRSHAVATAIRSGLI